MNEIWIVGFNGFQQIDTFCSSVKRGSNSKLNNFDTKLSTPSKSIFCKDSDSDYVVKADKCVITWSRILIILGDGKAYYNGADTCNLIECNDCHFAASMKSDLIVGDQMGSFQLITDSGTSSIKMDASAVDNDLCNICRIEGTETSIFSNFGDGKVEEWTIVSPCDNGTTFLCREPINLSERVKQVSCGKEHTLLLTDGGTVYSFGNGSRGQLGHNTVDNESEPRVIGMLYGVRMVSVAAGGWHSAVISEFGDLYIWGWNESGQLGFPKCDSKEYTAQSKKQKMGDTEVMRTSLNLPPPDRDLAQTKQQIKGSVIPSSEANRSILSNVSVLTAKACHSGDVSGLEQCQKTKTSTNHYSEIRKESDTFSSVCEKETEQPFENFDTADLSPSQLEKHLHVPAGLSSLEFPQACEGFQFQTVPRLVELDEQMVVIKVSCGSRHTAVLLDSGMLLSTGWNDYGQLCLGDFESRERFVSVPMFYRNGQRVVNVFCGHWNTVVVTTNADNS